MFNLNQLRHFRLVAETGNFAAAAEKAHITQPALSNSIRVLEERMGVRLFDRSARPIRLTAGGRDVLGRIDALLTEARNLEQEIRYLSQGAAGALRIGMTAQSSASIGGAILGPWLARNSRMSADVTVADTVDLLDRLRAEKMDLIIGDARDLPEASSDLEATPLPQQEGRAYCRAGHPVLDLPAPGFHDLLPYRFAGARFPVLLLDQMAAHFGLADRGGIVFALRSDNVSVLRDAASHSDLILLSTRGSVRDALDAGRIVELPVDLKTASVWRVVTLRNSALHPAIPGLRAAIDAAAGAA